MNKLRKVGSHFHRNRGKYFLGLCVVTAVFAYRQKDYVLYMYDKSSWYGNYKIFQEQADSMGTFLIRQGLYDDWENFHNQYK